MRTRQGFKFKQLNASRGWDIKGFLLMPADVAHFHEMISRGLSFQYAFERITAKPYAELSDVSLVVEYLPELGEVANG